MYWYICLWQLRGKLSLPRSSVNNTQVLVLDGLMLCLLACTRSITAVVCARKKSWRCVSDISLVTQGPSPAGNEGGLLMGDPVLVIQIHLWSSRFWSNSLWFSGALSHFVGLELCETLPECLGEFRQGQMHFRFSQYRGWIFFKLWVMKILLKLIVFTF